MADGLDDPAVVQLKANVLHLQSQIMLSKSILQMQAATIQAHETTIKCKDIEIFELRHLREYIHDPSQASVSVGTEPLVGRFLSVRDANVKGGLVLHIPEILRSLKRLGRKRKREQRNGIR